MKPESLRNDSLLRRFLAPDAGCLILSFFWLRWDRTGHNARHNRVLQGGKIASPKGGTKLAQRGSAAYRSFR